MIKAQKFILPFIAMVAGSVLGGPVASVPPGLNSPNYTSAQRGNPPAGSQTFVTNKLSGQNLSGQTFVTNNPSGQNLSGQTFATNNFTAQNTNQPPDHQPWTNHPWTPTNIYHIPPK
jgi:hypothetical protein